MPDTVTEVVEEIKPFAGASGTCSNTVALDYINKARRLLWNKTEFHETLDYIKICCVDQCFSLPSCYKQIRLAWIGNTPSSIGDEWYVSVPQVGLSEASSCHKSLAQVGGFHVIYQNYNDAPYQVGVQGENPLDNGTEITFFGIDENGTQKKETLTVGMPPIRTLSTFFYQDIKAVIKPITKGRIRLYAEDRQAAQFMLLAIYQPYDKNPQFRRFSVGGSNSDSITLYAKKTFYNLTGEDETVEFPTEAIKFAVMALVAQRDRDLNSYTENLNLAIIECNRETADNEIPTASPMRLFHTDTPEHLYRY